MRYKCLLADDSMLDLDALQRNILKIECLAIEAVCDNGLAAVKLIQEKEIDIVFTDIDMPELSGIGLLQSLRHPPVFIFISSHIEYAVESFNLDVIDFIAKPVTLPRLLKATNKAIEYIELKKMQELQAKMPQHVAPMPIDAQDHFFVKENAAYTRVYYADVIYVESMGNFSKIHTLENKKQHLTFASLKHIESQLPAKQFLRVHKQFIINLQHIVSLSSAGEIMLTGNNTLPLSSTYKPALMDVVNKRIISRSADGQ